MKEKNPVKQVVFFAIPRIPLIETGMDIASEVHQAANQTKFFFEEGDILLVAQKIVAKAEGRLISLKTVTPSAEAKELARKSGKPAELCELILQESKQILEVEPGIIVVEHKLGYRCLSAGIDRSNTGSPTGELALLLPENPDQSARKIREEIQKRTGKRVAVIITDSGGRKDRFGSSGEAIGVAGISPLLIKERKDLFGRSHRTEIALADSLAGPTSILMGESSEGLPVLVIRGIDYVPDENASIRALLKPLSE